MLISSASLLHLFLDSLQSSVGGGSSLLFPFKLQNISLHLFWYDHPDVKIFFLASLLLLLIVFFFEKKSASTEMCFLQKKNLVWFLLLVLMFLVLPFFFIKKAISQNLYSTLFVKTPSLFVGKNIHLPVSQVKTPISKTNPNPLSLEINPPFIVVQEGKRCFAVSSDVLSIQKKMATLKKGDWVSISGTYENKKIWGETFQKHH